MSDAPLLAVRDLERHYPVTGGILGRQVGTVRAVDGVSFELDAGEALAVVGESGCGKTTLAETVLGLEPPTAGEVRLRGEPFGDLPERERRRLRREVGAVFQDPASSLNGRMRVGEIVREPLAVHGWDGEHEARVRELLGRVGLDPGDHYGRYPHELSGGQKQRVAIARAIALDPALLVLDEPVSALDVSVQAGILSLLADLKAERGLAYLFVSHDLSVVRHVADRVAVMYLGRFVETAPADRLFAEPRHPYTEALLADVPRFGGGTGGIRLEGEPPDPADPPAGCRFHPRCHLRRELDDADARRCVREDPPLDSGVACHFRP